MQAKSESNVKIIDVSHRQKSIDWGKVKKDGVAGVLIKATEGKTFIDLKFAANAAGASAAGLKISYYHYARPELNSPEDEAANFFRNVKGQPVDFPYALDVEGEAAELGPVKLTAWCVKWLQEVERLSGRPTMLYTGADFARNYLGKELACWPLWVAHYGVDRPMANGTWDEWACFQYTSTGSVDGIVGNVDMNVMERSFFEKYCGAPAAEGSDGIKVVVNNEVVTVGQIIDGRITGEIATVLKAAGVPFTWHPEQNKLYIYRGGA